VADVGRIVQVDVQAGVDIGSYVRIS